MSPSRSSGVAGHVATTAHVQAAYPFMAETGLGPHGPYIGRDIYGGAFCYDPFHLYNENVVTNPNCLVIGQVGRGKSALLKTYLLRPIVFGRQAWIVDIKGEYAPLARALGVEPIRLEPRGRVTLNPLTPKGGPERQLDLAGSIAAAALARPLKPVERTALHTAPSLIHRARADRSLLARPHRVIGTSERKRTSRPSCGRCRRRRCRRS